MPISRSANAPSPALNLTGVWGGAAIDSAGRVEMIWQLTQRGADISGTVTAATNVGMPVYSGTVSGRFSSNTLRFTVVVPVGRIVEMPDCALTLEGTAADVQPDSMAGTYTGTHSCLGGIEAGRFLFIRQ